VLLHLKESGEMILAGRPVTRSQLASQVRGIFAQRRRKLLFLRVDDKVNYGLAVEVMDTCRGSGVETLGMTTKK
jgi:biopolymer transport protein ExbD